MTSMSDRLAAALGMLVTAALAQGQATVLHVDASAPPGGDGASWNTAFSDLQAALDQVAVGAPAAREFEIRVAQGTYIGHHEPRDGVGFRLLSHGASGVTLNLLGCFGGRQAADPDHRDLVSTRTVLSGDTLGDDLPNFVNRTDNVGPVMLIEGYGADRVLLDGLSITHGHVNGGFATAGGLQLGGNVALPTEFVISNCEVTDSHSIFGGGIFVADCVVRGCIIRGNAVQFQAGGAYMIRAALVDSVVASNTASIGGGLIAFDPSGNRGPTSFVSRSTIAGNTASRGSGGANLSLYAVEDTLIAGNSSAQDGSGLTANGTSVLSSTIVDNTGGAAGVSLISASWIGNTILLGNTPGAGGLRQVATTGTVSSTLERCLLPTGSPEGSGDRLNLVSIVRGNADFLSPTGPDGSASTWQDNDYRLLPTSLCVDAAVVPSAGHGRTQAPALDRDGVPRPLGAAEDLGCFERAPACDADFDGDGQSDQDDVAYLVQVIAGGSNPSGRDPDFNADGNVDQDDLASLVTRVAGGPCP